MLGGELKELFIPMTHGPETGAINRLHFFWRRFLVRVSYKSGTEFVWYQIPGPNRTLFYSKPERGIHMHATFWPGTEQCSNRRRRLVYVELEEV